MPKAPRLLVAVAALCAVVTSCTNERPKIAVPIPDDAPALGATDPTGPVQIVVWSSRPLPSKLAVAARALPGVLAVGARGSGIVDLRGATGATRPIPKRPAGAVVPIGVTSLAPALLRAFPEFQQVAAVLARGQAVVPRSAATFRGLGVGDVVRISAQGRTLKVRVGAIVDDSRNFRSEIVVNDKQGGRLGLGRERALVLAVSPDDAAVAENGLTRALAGFPARIRAGTGATGAPSDRRLLSLLELKTNFGEFWYRRVGGAQLAVDPAWRTRNIVYARVPQLGVVRCNRKIVPLLRGAMDEIERSGLANLVRTYDGCYNPRMQTSNAESLSRHAYGVAIDINARWNPYGYEPTMDPRVVEIMERWGFTWGGRWTVPDGMHFEFARFPEPIETRQAS